MAVGAMNPDDAGGVARNRAGASTAHNLAAILVDGRDPADDGLRTVVWDGGAWTLGDLRREVRARSAALAALGVRAGDRVLLRAPDSPQWIATFLGAVRIGAVVPLAGMGVVGDRLADGGGAAAHSAAE